MATREMTSWEEHTTRAHEARELFFFDEDDKDVVYLNGAFLGPTLRASAEAAMKGMLTQSKPWNVSFPKDFNEPVENLREVFGEIINAPARNIAILPSVAYAVSTVAVHVSKILEPGDKILALDGQYTSNILGWQRLCEERGSEMLIVPEPEDGDWTSAVMKALEADQPPKLIVLPAACHWCDGSFIDTVTITNRARELQARIFLDGTQSVGVEPVDVAALKPDYLAVAAYKWLLCPYGTAFMYVADEHCDQEPLEMHGFQRKHAGMRPDGSYDVQWLYNERAGDYKDGARRYDAGERASWVVMAMALEGAKQVRDWVKEDVVGSHTRQLLQYLSDEATKLGFICPSPKLCSSHIMGVRVPDSTPEELSRLLGLLKEARVLVSLRGNAIRVSPNLWSTKGDIDALLKVLAVYMEEKKA